MPLYRIDGHAPQVADDAWIAPSADLIGDVRVAAGCGVWFGAAIRADNTPIVLGERTNVQEGAVLHSDPGFPLTVGCDVTIGHRAILHGCAVGDGTLIGMGAIVLNGAVIGEGCLVGAGALVTEGKVFAAGSLIVGSPARAVRELDEAARARLMLSAAHYAERRRRYAAGLERVDAANS